MSNELSFQQAVALAAVIGVSPANNRKPTRSEAREMFPDKDFNTWLDQPGDIPGSTVFDFILDVSSAFQGYYAASVVRKFKQEVQDYVPTVPVFLEPNDIQLLNETNMNLSDMKVVLSLLMERANLRVNRCLYSDGKVSYQVL